jgi:sugar lactone lactonase YvrE
MFGSRRGFVPLASLSLLLTLTPAAFGAPDSTTGLEQPESAHWDSKTDAWYVSNTAGGYVSKIGPDGVVIEQQWLEDLHGPYGVTTHKGDLYVSDTDRVVIADLKTGKVEADIPVEASMMNDIAVDKRGDVYFSDTCGDIVFRIRKGASKAEPFVELPNEGPNGLAFTGNQMIVAGLGALPGVCGDPTGVGGRVLSVDMKTKEVTPVSGKLGALDGVVVDGKRFIVTDFATGRILAVDAATGASSLIAPEMPSAADLGFDPKARIIAVPVSFGNSVEYHDV